MAHITTPIRTIRAKESSKEILEKINGKWIEITEVFSGEDMSGKIVRYKKTIWINTEFIVEIED